MRCPPSVISVKFLRAAAIGNMLATRIVSVITADVYGIFSLSAIVARRPWRPSPST